MYVRWIRRKFILKIIKKVEILKIRLTLFVKFSHLSYKIFSINQPYGSLIIIHTCIYANFFCTFVPHAAIHHQKIKKNLFKRINNQISISAIVFFFIDFIPQSKDYKMKTKVKSTLVTEYVSIQ